MKPEHIYALYPKHEDHIASLRAIRNALKVTPANLLFEITRRFGLSWRGCDLRDCPTAHHFYTYRMYDREDSWGPRRVTKEPRNPERPLYGAVDRARNHHAPDAQLEAETLRKI